MPRTRSILWSELKLGVIGIAALTLATVLIAAVGGQGGFFWQRYALKARLTSAQGLKPGAIVRLNGKDVGKVTGVEFAGADIELVMSISKAVRPLVTTESSVSVGSISLLGEAIVDLTAAPAGQPLADWSYVSSANSAGGFAKLTSTAQEGADQLKDLVVDVRAGRGTLGKLATDDALYTDLRDLTASAGNVSRAIEHGKGTLGALTTDRAAYDSLRASLDHLQTVTARLESGQGTLGRLMHDDDIAQSLARTTANLADVTARLSHGDGTAGKLLHDDRVYEQLSSVSARLDKLLAQLNSGEGSAGQFLHNRSLYDNANSTVNELRGLLADIRKDPKKFLHMTFSIF